MPFDIRGQQLDIGKHRIGLGRKTSEHERGSDEGSDKRKSRRCKRKIRRKYRWRDKQWHKEWEERERGSGRGRGRERGKEIGNRRERQGRFTKRIYLACLPKALVLG